MILSVGQFFILISLMMSKALQIILIGLLTIVTLFVGRKALDKHTNHDTDILPTTGNTMEISEEHCRMMPTMEGCEIYNL